MMEPVHSPADAAAAAAADNNNDDESDNNNNDNNDNDDEEIDVAAAVAAAAAAAQHPENVLSQDLLDHPAILAFQASDMSFLVTNPRLPGNPIVYISSGFLELTGYPIDRILGRNCRFLQGPGTDPVAVARMREAIDRGQDISVTLFNYRHDGSTFWNQILISGVRDEHGEVTHFIGVQHPVEGPINEEEESSVLSQQQYHSQSQED